MSYFVIENIYKGTNNGLVKQRMLF